MGKKCLSLDIGGTKILGAVFDENDKIIYKIKKKTKAEKGIEQFEERLIKIIIDLIDESGINISEFKAISAGFPGIINEKSGEIIYAPNIPLKNYNIKNIIEKRFNIPFYLGNDVNLCTLGELKYGVAKGKSNIIGIFVGTGVGGGIVINNMLYTGATHAAGEIGHIILNTEGPLCNCGQKGCLEAYAGKIGIMRDIVSQISRGRESILSNIIKAESGIIKSKDLKMALENKDIVTIEALKNAIYYLSAGIGSMINVFNPEMVVLGGGVIGSLGEYIIPRLKKHLERFTMPDILKSTEIAKSSLEDYAGVYGGLALIKKN